MSAPGANLPADVAEAAAACAARAAAEGRTRWLAASFEVEGPSAVACHARIQARDRFLWQCAETGADWFAWGVADEIESAGPNRFDDVSSWRRSVAERIDRVGKARADTAPLCFGGFGFEPESRGLEDWKAFPAARFALPEAIVEGPPPGDTTAGGCFTAFVRVEPGAAVASVLETLAARRARFQSACGAEATAIAGSEPALADAAEIAASWADGPEFRVRADRPHAIFRGQVALALEAIADGALEKVVLARSLTVDHDGSFDVTAFLERLRSLYPTCALIAIGRGDDTFLAATPETLVRVRGDRVETAALAGSAPRGRTPEEDRTLGAALLGSSKERAEHAHVVDAIRGALAPRCESLRVPDEPGLRRLFGIQHLETNIEGRLGAAGGDVLALVAALHPTPAVGGVPRAAAQAWLQRHEGLDRGWYAAPVGWLDAAGGGDFRVALRSGLIRNGVRRDGGSRARLFAGAGLVEGSVPEQELAETRIKLRALLAPLTEI